MKEKNKKFSLLFDKHHSQLYNYSYRVLKSKDAAEEMVQETFIKLWNNFEKVNHSERSIASFLIKTLKNTIIDDYRKKKTRKTHTNLYTLNTTIEEEIDNEWEIYQQIETVYNSLQPNTTEIFQLSRDLGLTYKEIAAKKNISIKTVESHISKALVAFREHLKDYL